MAESSTTDGGSGSDTTKQLSNLSSQEEIVVQYDNGDTLYVKANNDPKQNPSLQEVSSEGKSDVRLRATLNEQVGDQTRIYVVISILSGTQLAAGFAKEILLPLLSRLSIDDNRYEIVHTTHVNTIIDFTRDTLLAHANNGTPQLVIVLSGDGGVIDILNALVPRTSRYLAPQISLIPMGTGNALANSSGLTDPTFGLAALVRGHPTALPMFKVSFSPGARLLTDEARNEEPLPLESDDGVPYLYGAVVCSWGMHATLVADSDTAEYRKHGADRFRMAAKEALSPADGGPPHAYKADIKVVLHGSNDWTDIPRSEHAYVLTTPVSTLEKGFTISPASKPLDGSLRIVHFGPMAGDEIMRLMTKAYDGGKHVDEPTVSYEEVDRVQIAFNGREKDGRWRRVCIDGKIVRVESDGWVEIERQQESILTLRSLA